MTRKRRVTKGTERELAGQALQSASWAAAAGRPGTGRPALEEATLILASQDRGRVVYDSRQRGGRRITFMSAAKLARRRQHR